MEHGYEEEVRSMHAELPCPRGDTELPDGGGRAASGTPFERLGCGGQCRTMELRDAASRGSATISGGRSHGRHGLWRLRPRFIGSLGTCRRAARQHSLCPHGPRQGVPTISPADHPYPTHTHIPAAPDHAPRLMPRHPSVPAQKSLAPLSPVTVARAQWARRHHHHIRAGEWTLHRCDRLRRRCTALPLRPPRTAPGLQAYRRRDERRCGRRSGSRSKQRSRQQSGRRSGRHEERRGQGGHERGRTVP